MTIRSYTELQTLCTFEERYDYLRLGGSVGRKTFGYERIFNQEFYRSAQWKRARNVVISRDLGCDLGVEGFEIYDQITVHHMNPITPDDFETGNPDILSPEYLITTTHKTHNAIHYGDRSQLPVLNPERRPGDTRLWSSLRR